MPGINRKWCFYGICTNVEDTYAKGKEATFWINGEFAHEKL